MSFSRGKIYLWQMLSTLLSASDEGKGKENHAVFWSTFDLAKSNSIVASFV
jgi:hypothetical protein